MSRIHRVSRIICVLVLALFLALPLSACKPSQPAKDVTIRCTFPTQFNPEAVVNQALVDRYKVLAAAFHEQNPRITIELVTTTWEQQLESLTAKDFDVILFGAASYSDFAERGLLSNLTPWISSADKAWSGDYLPTVLKPFERKGELWAIPWAMDPVILYYNRDLFSQNGVETPKQGWTWNDFLEKADATTDIEKGVFGSVILNESALVPAVIYQHGGQIFDDWNQPQPAEATFDKPRNVEALSWLSGLIFKDNVIPTHAQALREFGVDWDAVYNAMSQGKFGMWTSFYRERGGIIYGLPDRAWKVLWGAAPLPQETQAATMLNAYLLGISPQAIDTDACWKWLVYLSEQSPTDQFLPARTSLRKGMRPEGVSEQEAVSAGSAALEGVLLIYTDPRATVIPAVTEFWKAVSAILQKNEPVEAQLQQAQLKATQ
jgi:ABC-type glycerol-3-phosphate transport system substrate-binding protein